MPYFSAALLLITCPQTMAAELGVVLGRERGELLFLDGVGLVGDAATAYVTW
jgi:hypothetical protein